MEIDQLGIQKEEGFINDSERKELIKNFVSKIEPEMNEILLVPPDYTRKHSGAGKFTSSLYKTLKNRNTDINIDIMPALGTHQPMTDSEIKDMFGEDISLDKFIVHNWREDTVNIGTIPEDYIEELSEGHIKTSIDVNINKRLVDGRYDLIISIGQVLPHEVVGMANYNKNIFVGCGGEEMINKSHFLGAVYGMERLLGRDHSPVRKLYDYAQENFLQDIPIVYVLSANTTEIDPETGLTRIKGIFIGNERDVFEKAVDISQKVNIEWMSNPVSKVVVYLDEEEFKSTWLGCKAIYRTRKIIEDGGELIIIAPGLKQFGEDKENDRLIRKYGYVGKEKVLEYVEQNKELRDNLSVAAHLIHGSSEGRFEVNVACQHLEQEEIKNVNFNYMSLNKVLEKYNPEELKAGFNKIDGEEFYYIENPATGLWDLE